MFRNLLRQIHSWSFFAVKNTMHLNCCANEEPIPSHHPAHLIRSQSTVLSSAQSWIFTLLVLWPKTQQFLVTQVWLLEDHLLFFSHQPGRSGLLERSWLLPLTVPNRYEGFTNSPVFCSCYHLLVQAAALCVAATCCACYPFPLPV